MLEDDIAIQRLVAEVAYAFDSDDHAGRLPALLTDDIRLERGSAGRVDGLAALLRLLAESSDPALSHHVDTHVVEHTGPDTAICRSKVLTVRSGGRISAAEFTDTVTRTAQGWKIAVRAIRTLG